MEKKYYISTAGSSASLKWKGTRLTWGEFVSKLNVPVITGETVKEFDRLDRPAKASLKDVGGFMAGELSGSRRLKSAVISRSMITLDVDYGDDFFPMEFESIFPNTAAVIYGTRSDRPASRRFRLIVPLDSDLNPTEYEAAARKMAERLGIDLFDSTTFQPERMMYWQSLSSDQEKAFTVLSGEPISGRALLAMYGDGEEWRDIRNWTFHKDADKELRAVANKAMAQNPTEKDGLVGAFCRAYTIPSVIDKYLSDVYEEAGEGRYTYKLGTSAAGMIVFDDVFCISFHSTDPINDGHMYNAYDLVRVHKFGHLSKEDSTKEMNKLVCADKECVRDLVALDASDFDDYGDDVKADEVEDAAEMVWDLDSKGNKITTTRNFVNAFKSDALLNGLLGYDDFRDTIVYLRSPWFSKDLKKGDLLDDGALSLIRARIEELHSIYHKDKLIDALEVVSKENAFHPIKEYLRGLRWDGVPRVDTLLIDFMGAIDSAYVREATRKMLVAAVARIFEPGTKFDTALVMYSGQGVGKSTLIQKLAKGWFNDSLTDLSGNKAYESIQYSWIVELAELSAMRRSDVEATKNFISKREDTYRAAYARRVKTHRRQCVFFGSTNDNEFLKDATGNRRFFPVTVSKNPNTHKIFEKEFDEYVDMIWAEAVEMYMNGESLVLSESAEAEADGNRDEFTEKPPMLGIIEDYLDTLFPADYEERQLPQRRDFLNGSLGEIGTERKDEVCLLQIWCEALGKDKSDFNSMRARELSNAMKMLQGWERGRQKRFKLYGAQAFYRRVTEWD